LLGLAWFYLVLFVRIGPFQWVTSNPNKKLFGAFGVPIAGTGYGLRDILTHNSDFCEGNSPSAAIVSKIPARLGKAADDQVAGGRKSAEVVTGITAADKNSPIWFQQAAGLE
jgi:hypothetical protein